MFSRILLPVMITMLLAFNAMASSTCYSRWHYPAVFILGLNNNKMPRLALVGKHANIKNETIPFLEQTPQGWKETTDENCKPFWSCLNRANKCHVVIPEIKVSVDELMRYRTMTYRPEEVEQKISACTQHGDDVYFGISFYEGEGVTGVGGIGKYNVQTGQVEVRRLSPLLDSSVIALAYDGQDLWISAASHYECEGDVPDVPLMKYNWEKNQQADSYEIYGQCGFNVYDIVYDDNKLYIGSDMGLSVASRQKQDGSDDTGSRWSSFRHYIPDLDNPEKMVPTRCRELYENLLGTVPKAEKDQLLGTLIKFEPGYMKRKFLQRGK